MKITAKETIVLNEIAKGKTNAEISECLNISISTVEQYIRILMQKISAVNRAHLVYDAVKRGLIK